MSDYSKEAIGEGTNQYRLIYKGKALQGLFIGRQGMAKAIAEHQRQLELAESKASAKKGSASSS